MKKNYLNKKRKLEIVAQTSDSRLQTSVKGITLVALVITVIILLILAGVAISIITGQDGVFSRTENAATKYNEQAKNEKSTYEELLAHLGIEELPPSLALLEATDITTTTAVLKATGKDNETGIAKFVFYVDDTAYATVETREETATIELTFTGDSHSCYVIVYDKAGNYLKSTDITVTAPVTPSSVAIVGDFVNYSVDVDVNENGTIDEGETFDKWRILDFDNNGHMEIVCYNGPSFALGAGSGSDQHSNATVIHAKDDYATAIQQLNTASEEYKNGTYGYSARHLGSNPINPNNFATLSSTAYGYFKRVNPTVPTQLTDEGVNDTVYETDVAIIETFSGDKKLENSSWLASRWLHFQSSASYFRIRAIATTGSPSGNNLFIYYESSRRCYTYSHSLAPVVSLESGIKIDTKAGGDGSEGSPWVLII